MGRFTPFFTVPVFLAAMVLPVLAGAGSVAFSQIAAALSSGDGARALALSDAALANAGLTEPNHSRLLLKRGLANHLRGDADAALADLTEAMNAHALSVPERACAFLERGLVLDNMGRLNDAIGDYGAVLRLIPGSATALNNRANALRRQNRVEDARRDYLASLANGNPAPEYPYYGLGQIAESEGNSVEAKNFYARALTANPGYALAAHRLAALGGASITQDPITLRPPHTIIAEDAPVLLHPPIHKVMAVTAPPTIRPAGYSDRDIQPSLRPALDNPAGQQVQLGAWRDEAEAAAGWNHEVAVAGGALSGFSPQIMPADLPGKGRYYRLRVTVLDGRQLCAALAAKNLDCIPARD